jgi:alkylated DNA repair protein (DNA oxidative demethylase)
VLQGFGKEETGMDEIDLAGARVWPGLLDRDAQARLVEEVRAVVRAAPLVRPVTPSGKPMSVRLSAAGRFGWTTGPRGYAYAEMQADGRPWPPIPPTARALWDRLLPEARAPESCLVNFYGIDARMGLHQDRDEADFGQPVLSISLGDDGLFRIGGTTRKGPTRSVWLRSGDVLALTGPSRMAFHGVDRIKPCSSTLLGAPGRLNLTLRVVT